MEFLVKDQKIFTIPSNSCDKTATHSNDCHRAYTFTTSVNDGEEACRNANVEVENGPPCSPVHNACVSPLPDTWQSTHNMYEVCTVTFTGYEATDKTWEGKADTAVSAYSAWEELGQAIGP